jgi:uncharacterized protein (TIGR00297 family)
MAHLDLTRIGLALLLSTGVGALAFWRRSLTAGGWLGAVLTGTLTLGFGGWAWGLALVAFFGSSSLLSHYKEQVKQQRAGEKFEKGGQRDLWQTLANGGPAALLALLAGLLGGSPLLLAAYAGVLATVTADTWATELGVLSTQRPRLVTNGRTVEPGTSGGITLLGSGASAAGALTIGLVLLLVLAIEQALAGMGGALAWWLLPAALLGGVAGSLCDSLLGATVQAIYRYSDGRETERTVARDGTPTTFVRGWRWLNNDMVNLLSSLVGGGVAVLVWLLAA